MFDVVFQEDAALHKAGIASALLSLYAYLPYARDTLLGRTQPARACWLIWSVLSVIALASQIFAGATDSLWFAAFQSGGTLAVFALATIRGRGAFLNDGDEAVLLLASFGLVLWALTDNAAYALGISIVVSLLGGLVTIEKAYRAPNSETMSTWVCSAIAAGLALVSVGGLDPILLAYPAYLLVLSSAIVGAMVAGRLRLRSRIASIPAE